MRIQSLLVVLTWALASSTKSSTFSRTKKEELKNEAKDMFYHAYNAYMENAYPADELMPLSCRGRVRGVEPDRGDIDDALGKYDAANIFSLKRRIENH